MKIALFLQFHDYEPRFAIMDSDSFGKTIIEQNVLESINECPDVHQTIVVNGRAFPEDNWGIFGTNLRDIRINEPVKVDKFVTLLIDFDY